ncbi:hypothetical protein F5J12DRAFT_392783 [Pisolithus orientalis]|uniref:uncharacterized protein n=1 Tax=Pisolithus orientalis TaxID=936130 RepID=UPI0022254BF3|nr:uncharacterized protein F5J12DRAFT_392783 [Pisolithus orientalis]KAI6028730.1 hypothetical protein F5J12DRAFT_392783 [Pisolithus orientalis]
MVVPHYTVDNIEEEKNLLRYTPSVSRRQSGRVPVRVMLCCKAVKATFWLELGILAALFPTSGTGLAAAYDLRIYHNPRVQVSESKTKARPRDADRGCRNHKIQYTCSYCIMSDQQKLASSTAKKFSEGKKQLCIMSKCTGHAFTLDGGLSMQIIEHFIYFV